MESPFPHDSPLRIIHDAADSIITEGSTVSLRYVQGASHKRGKVDADRTLHKVDSLDTVTGWLLRMWRIGGADARAGGVWLDCVKTGQSAPDKHVQVCDDEHDDRAAVAGQRHQTSEHDATVIAMQTMQTIALESMRTALATSEQHAEASLQRHREVTELHGTLREVSEARTATEVSLAMLRSRLHEVSPLHADGVGSLPGGDIIRGVLDVLSGRGDPGATLAMVERYIRDNPLPEDVRQRIVEAATRVMVACADDDTGQDGPGDGGQHDPAADNADTQDGECGGQPVDA